MTNQAQHVVEGDANLSTTERAILCSLIMEGDNYIPSQRIANEAECALDSVKVLVHHMRDKGIPIESGYGRGYRLRLDRLLSFLAGGPTDWMGDARRRRLSRMP